MAAGVFGDRGHSSHIDLEDDLNAKTSVVWLWSLFFVALLVRWITMSFFTGPSQFEEWRLWELASSLGAGKGVFWDGLIVDYPSRFYIRLIAPFIPGRSFESAYAAVRFINCALMASTVWCLYAFARMFATRAQSIAAAGLGILSTVMLSTGFLLPDAALVPLTALTFWVMTYAFCRPTMRWRILVGIALGLLFHVKPQLLFAPIGFFSAALLYEGFKQNRSISDRFIAWCQWWPVLPAWLVAFGAPRVITIRQMAGFEAPLDFRTLLGTYADELIGTQPIAFGALIGIFIALTLGLIFATGILPFFSVWYAGSKMGMKPQAQKQVKERYLLDPAFQGAVALVIAFSVIFTLLAAYHATVADETWHFFEQDYAFVIPMFFAVFCALPVSDMMKSKLIRIVSLVVLTLFMTWIAWGQRETIGIHAQSLGWVFLLGDGALRGIVRFLPVILIMIVAVIWWIQFSLVWIYPAILLLALNIGYYVMYPIWFEQKHGEAWQMANDIDQSLGEHDRLMIIIDDMDLALVRNLSWRRAGALYFVDEQWAKPYVHPLKRTEAVSIAVDVSDDPVWIVTSNQLKLLSQPDRQFLACNLYSTKNGPLTLERDFALVDPASLAGTLNIQVRQTPVTDTPWVLNTEKRFYVTIQNVADVPTPTNSYRLALGYRWMDPQRTGEWVPILPDNGSRLYFEKLESGESIVKEFAIIAPDVASETSLLIYTACLQKEDAPDIPSGSYWAKEAAAVLEYVIVAPKGK